MPQLKKNVALCFIIHIFVPNTNFYNFNRMIKSNDLVVKSNSLVEARYKLSIWESRVFAKMVTMINKDDKEFATYEIGIRELMRFFETKAHNDFERIKEVPEMLVKRTIKVPIIDEGKEAFLVANMISSAIIPRDEELRKDSILKLSFDPKLKPYLLELKEKFLKYDIKNVLRISSPNSIRVYELLKQYEKIGYRVIKIETLKKILGIEGKYKRYNHLKDRVIKQAEKDLGKYTDICFKFDEIKRGRKVIALKFYIYKNKPLRKDKTKTAAPKELEINTTAEVPDFADPIHNNKAYQMLIDKKVSQDQAFNLVNNFDTQFILETIQKCDKENEKMKKKNLAGFIVDSVKKERYQQDIKAQQEAKEQKKNEAQEKKIKEQHHQLIKQHFDQFEQEKKQKIEQIKKGLSEEETAEILTATKTKYPRSSQKSESEWIDSIFFGFVVAERYQDTPQLQKIDYNFYYWMEQVHNAKVIKNKQTDMFELVS